MEVWKAVYRLFTVSADTEPLAFDLVFTARVVLLGLYLHATQIIRSKRYESRTPSRATFQHSRRDCYWAVILFITGFVGLIVHTEQREAAERSPLTDGPSCASHHGHHVKRDGLLGTTDPYLSDSIRPFAAVCYLSGDLFFACLQVYRAFLSRPKSNGEGSEEEENPFAHGWLSLLFRNGLEKRDSCDMERDSLLATDQGRSTPSNGHRDRPEWHLAIWLYTGDWYTHSIIVTCFLPEMYFFLVVGLELARVLVPCPIKPSGALRLPTWP